MAATLLLAAATHAEGWIESLEPGLLLEWETAVDTGTARFQKSEISAWPELEIDLAGPHQVTALARVRLDAFDRIDPGRVSSPEVAPLTRRRALGNHGDVELRELFLESDFDFAHLTLGKQQLVWGEADGLKVLDRLNPQSFREFILDEFERSRIPLWTVNVEVPMGEGELQLVWIPDPSHHELPRTGGVFEFRSPRLLPPLLPGFVPVVGELDRPGNAFDDSDAGLRWNGFLGGFDLSLSYLYQYDDRPVFDGTLTRTELGPTAFFTPTYERTHVVGATFSNAFGDLTVRGELLWQSDRYLSTTDPTASRLLVNTPEVAAVLGLDWYGFRGTLVSLQVFPSILVEDSKGLLRDRVDVNLTLFLQRRLLNDRLGLEAIWIHNVNQGDGMVRPRARFELRDGLDLALGFDLFYGTENGLFGQYRANDRAVFAVEWSL